MPWDYGNGVTEVISLDQIMDMLVYIKHLKSHLFNIFTEPSKRIINVTELCFICAICCCPAHCCKGILEIIRAF